MHEKGERGGNINMCSWVGDVTVLLETGLDPRADSAGLEG